MTATRYFTVDSVVQPVQPAATDNAAAVSTVTACRNDAAAGGDDAGRRDYAGHDAGHYDTGHDEPGRRDRTTATPADCGSRSSSSPPPQAARSAVSLLERRRKPLTTAAAGGRSVSRGPRP